MESPHNNSETTHECPLEYKYLPRNSVRDATYARLRGEGWTFAANKTAADGTIVSTFYRPIANPTMDDRIAADKAASHYFDGDADWELRSR